jgi:hypothetical protein
MSNKRIWIDFLNQNGSVNAIPYRRRSTRSKKREQFNACHDHFLANLFGMLVGINHNQTKQNIEGRKT